MKDPGVFVRHIVDSIGIIEKYVFNKTKDDFLEDIQLQDAIIRRIETIDKNMSS